MRPHSLLRLLVPAALLLPACAADDNSPASSISGGSAGSGGASPSGGASSGGAPAGGSANVAGAAGQGGPPGIGGASGHAGTAGLGGASSGSGGSGGGAGNGGGPGGPGGGAGHPGGSGGAAAGAGGKGTGGQPGGGSGGAPPCTSHISYGNTWIHGAGHPQMFDDTDGAVSWDGACTVDGANSFALLSNGWKPYFSGHECVLAIDQTSCPGQSSSCATRIGYGATWSPAPGHPQHVDDVGGRVFWDGACHPSGGQSLADLSNGFTPYFQGPNACELSFDYTQCGGLYENPVIPVDCPDPGVLRDGSSYYLVCTGGDAGGTYVIRHSTDLVHWKAVGHIFPSGKGPGWANGSFWAPEIHKVGTHYVAYFSARHTDGVLSIGAATGPTPTGPFTDLGHPLVHDPTMGMIDVTEFEDASGTPYLVWKSDGNAVGKPTPIHGQKLSPDGTSLLGSATTLITNDQSWEGPLVEGPWVIRKNGTYYLFYSANSYANATYAVGVARSSSPLGPYQKAGPPILTTSGAWVGPGHCSVVDTPAGDTYMVYHAWQAGHVGGPGDGRLTLVDAVTWSGGWPAVPAAPSSASRPMP